jgi:hypothetical protein
MFQWIISFLSAPIFDTLLKGWQAKLDSQTAAGVQAADVAKKAMETEVQQRQANAGIVVATMGRWYTALPMTIVMGSAAAFFTKCVVWDTMLGWGSTPALGGDVQTSYNLIMAFWFGSAGVRGSIAAIRGLWR